LKDIRAKAVIFNRLDRATKGNFGDAKALGGGVSEMRIDSGLAIESITPDGARLFTCCSLVATNQLRPEISSALKHCSSLFPRSNP